MRGVLFEVNIGKIILKKIGLGGKYSMIKYRCDYPVPIIEKENHVLVKTVLAGICASDLHQIDVNLSYIASLMAAKNTKFMTLGHEVIGVVEQVGTGVDRVKVGDQVVYNPVADCIGYGIPPCPSCRDGNHQSCYCLVGHDYAGNRDASFGGFTGGGFSEYFLGFENQFYKVPEDIPDEIGVLAEPLAVGLHAVLRHPPRDDEVVLVIGAGIIGLMIITAIRAVSKCRIISVAKYDFQGTAARKMGAGEIIFERDSTVLLERVAAQTGGRVFKPLMSKPILFGDSGPSVIYDSVGTESSINDSLAMVQCGGRVVVVGMAFGITKRIDWAIVNYKEIEVAGVLMHGMEPFKGKNVDAFDLALDLLGREREKFSGLVTHTFSIEKFKDAFEMARSKGKHAAIKIAFDYR